MRSHLLFLILFLAVLIGYATATLKQDFTSAWTYVTYGTADPHPATDSPIAATSPVIAVTTNYIYYVGSDNSESGNFTAYVSQLHRNSSVIWTKKYQSLTPSNSDTNSFDRARAAVADASENLFVVGSAYGDLGIGLSCTSAHYSAFVLKLLPNSTIAWKNCLGASSGTTTGYAVALDGTYVYVAGSTNMDLGPGQTGDDDLFLAQFVAASGTKNWVVQLGTVSVSVTAFAMIAHSGSIYVAGATTGNLPTTVSSTTTYAGSGDLDAFLTKYNSTGGLLWTIVNGTSAEDFALGVAFDSSWNVYTAGYTLGNIGNLVNLGSSDMFLAKYSPSGTNVWLNTAGTSGDDVAANVILDSSDRVFVTGFSTGSFPSVTPANAGGRDLCVLRFGSANGSLESIYYNGTSADDGGTSMALSSTDPATTFFVAGYTDGSFSSSGQTCNSGSQDCYFLTKLYDAAAASTPTSPASSSSNDVAVGVGVGVGLGVPLLAGAAFAVWYFKFRAPTTPPYNTGGSTRAVEMK